MYLVYINIQCHPYKSLNTFAYIKITSFPTFASLCFVGLLRSYLFLVTINMTKDAFYLCIRFAISVYSSRVNHEYHFR